MRRCLLVWVNYRTNPLRQKEITGYLLPNLGLDSIYTNLKIRHPDWDLDVFDGVLNNLTNKDIKNEIFRVDPDVVGFSSVYMNLNDCLDICRMIKEENPNIVTVVGGPGAKSLKALRRGDDVKDLDYCVIGDGENLFEKIVEENKMQEKTLHLEDSIVDLDTISFPKRECFDINKYFENQKKLGYKDRMLNIYTSKGCDYGKCTFCTVDSKLRTRSEENIRKEVGYIYEKFKPTKLIVSDDAFAPYNYKERTLKICNIFNYFPIKWLTEMRVKDLTMDLKVGEKLLEKMKESGCDEILLGCESGDANMLRFLEKGIRPEDIENAVNLTNNVGIKAILSFMYDMPRESERSLENTANFLKHLLQNYDHLEVYFWRYEDIPDSKVWGRGKDMTSAEILEDFKCKIKEFCFSNNVPLHFKYYG